MKEIVLGCDNAATELKEIVKNYLIENGHTVEDCGCNSKEDKTNYPLIAEKVCNKIIESDYKKRGVLICGTGLGMAIAANKFKGIRAGVCHDSFSAERLVLSNNGNVICFGARVVGNELAKKVLGEFLSHTFAEGPSSCKIADISLIESKNMQ